MGSFKGKDSSGWKDASAVYGKDASGWLYAKEAWAKNASGWQRAWTDCRLYDATGGRGWSDPVSVVTYNGSCGNRTATTTVTRTKIGCPNDVRATTVASPDCNKYDTNCYNAATGAYEYRYSCASREYRVVYTFTAKPGTACATQYSYTDWGASPTCEGACTTAETVDSFEYGGQTLFYYGSPGYYAAFFSPNCNCPQYCFAAQEFYVTTCNGVRNTPTLLGCDPCSDFNNNPC